MAQYFANKPIFGDFSRLYHLDKHFYPKGNLKPHLAKILLLSHMYKPMLKYSFWYKLT